MHPEGLSDVPTGSPQFYSALATKRVGAGCVFLDEAGRILLVNPTYKPGWELPGGAVEENESPYDAARREVREELGLDIRPGRLLVLDYRQAVDGVRGDSLMMLFSGGTLTSAEAEAIVLPQEELSEWRFVPAEDLDHYLIPVMARRLRHCLARSSSLYLEEGRSPS